jgi:hypothetical protein
LIERQQHKPVIVWVGLEAVKAKMMEIATAHAGVPDNDQQPLTDGRQGFDLRKDLLDDLLRNHGLFELAFVVTALGMVAVHPADIAWVERQVRPAQSGQVA